MFSHIEPAPVDPILGLTEAFQNDPRPNKVNLGVGVFVDEQRKTPVLESVRKAERLLWESEQSKIYTPIPGPAEFAAAAGRLILGADLHKALEGRVAVAQTPGGTGALRIGAELIQQFRRGTVWLPQPTWENHPQIFRAAGCPAQTYPYYDMRRRGVDFEALCAALERIPPEDTVLFHVCCHNPTGADLDAAAWRRIAEIAARAGWLPFFDFAYQGFGDGLAADRAGLLTVLPQVRGALVAYSFAKNMGLYGERVGALLLVAETPAATAAAFSQIKRIIRAMYSNPPRHGAALARLVLELPDLRALWKSELQAMHERISGNRCRLAEGLAQRRPDLDFSYLKSQKGMFSYSGLTDAQVDFLREQKGIYLVKGGRINVAGLTAATMDYVCDAIAASLALPGG